MTDATPFQNALEAIDACRRSMPANVTPTVDVYLQGAYGCMIHARDVFIQQTKPDAGSRWVARLEHLGLVQVGDRTQPLLSAREQDELQRPRSPDLGATVVRSEALRELTSTSGFSAMLAYALAEHRWLHVATGSCWTSSWAGADAIVRAVNEGRSFPRLTAAEMRGTIDRRVAVELARLGWRRISSPKLPDAA